MNEVNDIPENIREKINKLIQEVDNNRLPPTLKFIMVNICFEMYKIGWRDAHRAMAYAIEKSKEMMVK